MARLVAHDALLLLLLLLDGRRMGAGAATGAAGSPSTWPLERLPVTKGGRGAGRAGGAVLLTDYGGVADAKTDNAPAFQRALAFLANEGGGVLVVPAASTLAGAAASTSVYASMPIVINTSGVTLVVEANVRVVALCNIPAWPTVPGFDSFEEGTAYAPFVHAANVTDLVIEGAGAFDGNGSCFWEANKAVGHKGKLPFLRPRLMVIAGSQRVSLQDFTTHNSAYWNIVLFQTVRHARRQNVPAAPLSLGRRLALGSVSLRLAPSHSVSPCLSRCLCVSVHAVSWALSRARALPLLPGAGRRARQRRRREKPFRR